VKRIVLFLIFTLGIGNVYAKELNNITNQSQIKYKWYKEEFVDGMYYPKKDKLNGYVEDITNIKYSDYSVWNKEYCNYSLENYILDKKTKYIYQIVSGTKYIKLENISHKDINEIQIFYRKNLLNYEIIENTEEIIKIELNNFYETNDLWFYIDTDKEYDIVLSGYKDYSTTNLSKHIKQEKFLLPDKTWLTEKTMYATHYTEIPLITTDFIKLKNSETICRVKEIETYRYKINKIYFDDNYYTFIENYLPDKNDYIIEYNGQIPKETITITKTETIKEKEYIYLENSEIQQNEQLNIIKQETEIKNNEQSESKPIIETKYVEKEVLKEIKKVPKTIYVVILFLLLIIITETIVIIKKKVEKNF